MQCDYIRIYGHENLKKSGRFRDIDFPFCGYLFSAFAWQQFPVEYENVELLKCHFILKPRCLKWLTYLCSQCKFQQWAEAHFSCAFLFLSKR